MSSSDRNEEIPLHGVLLQVLDDFIEECGGIGKLRGRLTSEVCEHFVLPLTSRKNVSYCELLLSEQSPSGTKSRVGPATHFISHAWQYDFLDVVDCLKQHFHANADSTAPVYIWFDLFSNNQHDAPHLDHHWWSRVFASAIERIGHTVVVLSPWDDPIPFKRCWCLYEIFCTIQAKKPLSIIMTKHQEDLFIKALMADPEAIDKMIGTVDLRRSKAMNRSDEDQIMQAVESTVGFDVLNQAVFTQLRQWLISTAKKSLADVEKSLASIPDEPINVSSRSHLLSHQAMLKQIVAFIHWKLSMYDQALPEYKECLQLLIRLEHKEVLNWKEAIIKGLRDLGLLYRDMKNYDDAKKCLEEAVHRCEDHYTNVLGGVMPAGGGSLVNKVRGMSNVMPMVDKIDILHQLGSTLRRTKDYVHAEKYYLRCVHLFAALKGDSDGHTLVAKANLGTMLSEQGKDEEAKIWFDQCMDGLKNVLSERALMKQISPVTSRDGEMHVQRILPIYKQCYQDRLKELGEGHPSTLLAMLQLAVLYRKDHNLGEAKTLLQSCVQIATVKLGENDMSIVTKAQVELALLVLESSDSGEDEILAAIKSLEGIVAKMRKALGDSDPDVHLVMERIVKEYLLLGALQYAEQQCLEYEQFVQKAFGKESPKTTEAKGLLLQVYTKQLNKYWSLQEELANELQALKDASEENQEQQDPAQTGNNESDEQAITAVEESKDAVEVAEAGSEEIKSRDVSLSKLKLIELLNNWKDKNRISNTTCIKATQEIKADGLEVITFLQNHPDPESKEFGEWEAGFEALLYPEYLYVKAGGFLWLVDKRYNISETIGSGAHGTVARATDEKTGDDVAIKAITHLQRDQDALVRSLRELRILKHLSGEIGFLKLCDAWVDPPEDRDFNSLFFAVNWMSVDLHNLIQSDKTLAEKHIQHFLFHILLAVKYMHLTGIIHRDLKPENILINSQCDVAIADFSLSRGFRRIVGHADEEEDEPVFTELVVTRWYRAPEVIYAHNSYDEKIDLWSVGCVLAELYLRKPLFPGVDTKDQFEQIFSKIQMTPEAARIYQNIPADTLNVWQEKARTAPLAVNDFPNMSANAFDLLTQLLQLDPHQRPSAGEALQHPFFASLYNQYSSEELLETDNMPPHFDFSFEKDLRNMSTREVQKALVEEVSYFRHFV